MTNLYTALQTLAELVEYKSRGGSTYKLVDKIMKSETATHNIQEATTLLNQLKDK